MMNAEIEMEMSSQTSLNVAAYLLSALIYFCLTTGFLIKILVDNELVHPMFFANEPLGTKLQPTIVCVLASSLYLVCALLGCHESRRRMVSFFNKLTDGIFMPLLLCQLVNINDLLPMLPLIGLYLIVQMEFLESGPTTLLGKIAISVALNIFWVDIFISAHVNRDENVNGGGTIAAQVFAFLVVFNDLRYLRKKFTGKLYFEEFSAYIDLALRIVVLVCVFVETL